MKVLDRITINPDVCFGQPTIRGMRITVSLIVKLVANGLNAAQIIEAYPELEKEDITQALQYAAWLSSERAMNYSSSGAPIV